MSERDAVELFEEGSALDLVLRGFTRDEVRERTGVDPGYNGNTLRASARGVDPQFYRIEHVRRRVRRERVIEALVGYGNGQSRAEILFSVGLANQERTIPLKTLFVGLGMADEFAEADRRARRSNMAAGMIAKHGVANPFELDEFQEKAKGTRVERYGGEYTFSISSSLAEGAHETFRKHLEDDDFRESMLARRTATVRDYYGVDSPMQSAEVKKKARATNRERYGEDHWSKTDDARAAQSQRALLNGEEWARKARATSLARYGVENPSQRQEARRRQSTTMRAEFSERDVKARATHLERHGVLYPSQRESHKALMRELIREHGEEMRARARETSMARYGVPYPSQRPDARAAQSDRMLDPAHQARVVAAKKANGTLNGSAVEDRVHGMLVEEFDDVSVKRQYSDVVRYPFACDFYIPSRDLFIELNGSWTHGPHWFDDSSEQDLGMALSWLEKASEYYRVAVDVWTRRDVMKREAAREHQLNYVVFWGNGAEKDAGAWIAAGCPDAQDWDREYAWADVAA